MAYIDVKEVSSQIKKGDYKNLYYFYGRNVSVKLLGGIFN